MQFRKLFHPALTLFASFMLYSGCTKNGETYIYGQLTATPYIDENLLVNTDTVSIDSLYIQVKIPLKEIQLTSCLSLKGNMAFALSFPVYTPRSIETISDIRIRPISNYNLSYGELDNMFADCIFSSFHNSKDTLSKDDLINYTSGALDYEIDFIFRFATPPSHIQQQQFIVELITDQNRRIADTTHSFTITP